jgi:hypothetical protein
LDYKLIVVLNTHNSGTAAVIVAATATDALFLVHMYGYILLNGNGTDRTCKEAV